MVTSANDKRKVRICLGREYNLGVADNTDTTWGGFCKLFIEPRRTPETFETYRELPADRQARLKARDGWYLGGAVEGGRRRKKGIRERDIVTLDLDRITPEMFENLLDGHPGLADLEYVCHTTRSHSPEAPRVRMNFLLRKPVERDEYAAVSRVLAHRIDETMDAIDDVSFRPAQMMFMPVVSADQEYETWRHEGDPLDAARLLADWGGDWTDHTSLPYSENRGMKRPTAEKAEDPWEKPGPIGAFCRAWPVPDAIDEFLDGVYVAGKEFGSKPRYTYAAGSTSNGAVVEDDGRFLYSHHGTDPCSDQLVNSFDLIRIHRFGDKDAGKDLASVDVTELPSYRAMLALALEDRRTKDALLEEDLSVEEDFDLLDRPSPDALIEDLLAEEPQSDTSDSPSKDTEGLPAYPGTGKPARVRGKWWRELELTQTGQIKNTLPNITKILLSDRSLHGVIARNLFSGKICAKTEVRSKLDSVMPIEVADEENGEPWSDDHDTTIRMILEERRAKGVGGYGMKVTDRDVAAAVRETSRRWRFHPVIDRLLALPEWDGQARVERLWIDYLGAPDTAYHRETARQFLCGAIARLYSPGHKFDFVPILAGPQGRRKSTFVAVLFFDIWAGELTVEMTTNKDAVEQMLGVWCLELAELASMAYNEIEAQKAFVSRTEDKVRLSYDRRMGRFPRQCVFAGTSNPVEYLKDDENRRYWPVNVLVEEIDTDRLAREREQLWAEALVLYGRMCRRQNFRKLRFGLSGDALREALFRQDAARTETRDDEVFTLIEAWLNRPVPVPDILGAHEFEDLDNVAMGLRVKTCTHQLREDALAPMGLTNAERRGIDRSISQAMSRMTGWGRPRLGADNKISVPGYPGRRRGWLRTDATRTERDEGFRNYVDPTSEVL